MNRYILALVLIILPTLSLAADEELRELVKSLSRQVQELTNRVSDLETELARARHPGQQSAANSTAGNPAAADSGLPQSAEKVPSRQTVAQGASNPDVSNARWSPIATGTAKSDIRQPNPADRPAHRDGKAVTAGDITGSFKIPGTETSLAIGGYAKLDAIYNSVGAGNNSYGDQFLMLSAIPVGTARTGENSQTILHAKESRFWFKSFTPSSLGDINTYMELDLYGSPDSYTPRLRHAYGSLGPFLGGQTWTTFLNVAAIPETLDIGSPVGIGLIRQPMIRWTQPMSMSGSVLEFQAALESPSARLAFPDSPAVVSPNDDRYPDLIARVNYDPEWGGLSLAAVGRQIRYAPPTGSVLSQWGGAVSLAGKIKTLGPDNLRFTLSYGNALGRYATLNTFPDAVVNNAGDVLSLANTFSAMLSYQHWWNNRWRSTLAYGYAQSDLPPFANGRLTRQGQSAHVNLLWSPFLQTTFGLEYIYATRSLESGPHGDLHRVQFSSRFNF